MEEAFLTSGRGGGVRGWAVGGEGAARRHAHTMHRRTRVHTPRLTFLLCLSKHTSNHIHTRAHTHIHTHTHIRSHSCALAPQTG